MQRCLGASRSHIHQWVSESFPDSFSFHDFMYSGWLMQNLFSTLLRPSSEDIFNHCVPVCFKTSMLVSRARWNVGAFHNRFRICYWLTGLGKKHTIVQLSLERTVIVPNTLEKRKNPIVFSQILHNHKDSLWRLISSQKCAHEVFTYFKKVSEKNIPKNKNQEPVKCQGNSSHQNFTTFYTCLWSGSHFSRTKQCVWVSVYTVVHHNK